MNIRRLFTLLFLPLVLVLAASLACAQSARVPPRLRAELIVGDSTVALDPALRDPANVRRVAALAHPKADDFDPAARRTAYDRLLAAYARDGASAVDRRADVDLRDDHVRRAAAVSAADAAYVAVHGTAPRSASVPPPPVDLALRVHNPSDRPVSIRVDGDSTSWRMRLHGPAAHHAWLGGDPTEIYFVGRLVTIPAHGHVDLPIRDLSFGDRATACVAYPTAPGRYRLDVAFRTQIEDGASRTPIEVRPAPITLLVR